jgi:hypothetical protein
MNLSTKQSDSVAPNSSSTARTELINKFLEECKVSTNMISYIEKFNYPYANDVNAYELVQKIGQGTFGYLY